MILTHSQYFLHFLLNTQGSHVLFVKVRGQKPGPEPKKHSFLFVNFKRFILEWICWYIQMLPSFHATRPPKHRKTTGFHAQSHHAVDWIIRAWWIVLLMKMCQVDVTGILGAVILRVSIWFGDTRAIMHLGYRWFGGWFWGDHTATG